MVKLPVKVAPLKLRLENILVISVTADTSQLFIESDSSTILVESNMEIAFCTNERSGLSIPLASVSSV